MATLTAVTPPIVSRTATLGTNAGQDVGFAAAAGGGDFIPLNGQGVIFTIKTAGTACTATLDSVVPSSFGDDKNVTMVLGTNAEQHIFIKNDGRMDQGGVNAGLMAVTYSAVTNVSVRVTTIPGF